MSRSRSKPPVPPKSSARADAIRNVVRNDVSEASSMKIVVRKRRRLAADRRADN